MIRLLAVCCILAVVGLIQHVEGGNSCITHCRARCKTIKNRRQTSSNYLCLRRCARISRKCEACVGPNQCITCTSGYQLSFSSLCVDTDECTTTGSQCSAHATCTNTIGSYTCSCNRGFTGDGKTCTDVDECATNNGGCAYGAKCNNTVGSYTCTCGTGYIGNGTLCTGQTLKTKSTYSMYVTAPTTPFTITDKKVYGSTSPPSTISFLILPCLITTPTPPPSTQCVSLMLEFWPNAYLFQNGYLLQYGPMSASVNSAAAWPQDASFYMHTDTFSAGFVAFESAKFPGLYLHVFDTTTATPGYKLSNDAGTTTFHNDASFQLIPRTV